MGRDERLCGVGGPSIGPCVLKKGHPRPQEHRDADGEFFLMDPDGSIAAARTFHDTLEDAVRAIGIRDAHMVAQVRDLEATLEPLRSERPWRGRFDYWTTPSLGYVAIGDTVIGGPYGTVRAYVHKSMARDSEGNVLATFTNRPAASAVCPTCFMTLPGSGVCDTCD